MKYTRREFLHISGLLSASLLLNPSCTSAFPKYRILTEDEAACLIPLCEQIIPADEKYGGATDAGVINFIDRQLDLRLRKDIPLIRSGVECLQASCEDAYSKKFQELSSDEQIKVMNRMQKNNLPKEIWGETNQSDFFRTMIKYTMMGFYGPPRHGGNRNYMSYRMLKLDIPMVSGQNRYRKS